MWMPIMLFFFMGFEHSIVNMFLFPAGLMLGGDFTITDYLIWNEIPTVLGNLVGGLVFTALPLYLTYARTKAPRTPTTRRLDGSKKAASSIRRPVASRRPSVVRSQDAVLTSDAALATD
jgi:L-lactate permease